MVRKFVLSFIVVAVGLKATAASKENYFSLPQTRKSSVEMALRNAQLNPEQSIQISWKKLGVPHGGGRYFNALIAVCINSNPDQCVNIGETGAVDKNSSNNAIRPVRYSVEKIGQFLARNDVRNLNLAVRLANQDGISRKYIEFESFKLSDLVNNNVIVEFKDGSQVEIKLI